MGLARLAATRATCDRAHVGAVAVRARTVLATGYNGAPRGLPHCDDIGHLLADSHCVRTVHAEANVIAQAAKNGIVIVGAAIYCTHLPCLHCANLLINAGISEVIFDYAYRENVRVYDTFRLASVGLREHSKVRTETR